MGTIPLVIDSDPGVDDCIAILFAHFVGVFDFRAITAVAGNVSVNKTLRNALFLKDRFGIPCRVAKGASRPLAQRAGRDASVIHGEGGIGSWRITSPLSSPDSYPAWEVIYQEAQRAGGKLRIAAIGPLTNIAIALEKHPDLPMLVDRLCIMGGGSFGNAMNTNRSAEFNIFMDPEAAQKVFDAFDVHMAGLDACFKVALTEAELDELTNLCRDRFVKSLLLHMMTSWIERGFAMNVPYDLVGVAQAMDDPPVWWRKAHVRIECDHLSDDCGKTYIGAPAEAERIAFEAECVDRKRLFSLLRDMVENISACNPFEK